MARYSVLRLLIFFGLLSALYLLGLRDEGERWWLLGISALGSTLVSYFLLKGPREEFSARIASHLDERARRAEPARTDETAEDAEDASRNASDPADKEIAEDFPPDSGDFRDSRDSPRT